MRPSVWVVLRRLHERATKIPVSVLYAIERNDERHLPQKFFTRAFIRTYAAEVGLDANALLDGDGLAGADAPAVAEAAMTQQTDIAAPNTRGDIALEARDTVPADMQAAPVFSDAVLPQADTPAPVEF